MLIVGTAVIFYSVIIENRRAGKVKQQQAKAVTELARAAGATSMTVCEPDVDDLLEVEPGADDLQCATCFITLPKETFRKTHYYCPRCGDMVCVKCGCTDSRACAEGCWWIEPGICSAHEGER